MMENRRLLNDTAKLMIVLNFGIILFYCLVCPLTIYRVCHTLSAYDYLSAYELLPAKPWIMPIFALSLYSILVYGLFRKQMYESPSRTVQISFSLLEIIACLGIIVSLNYYYTGIVLMVLADLVNYFKNNKIRLVLMIVLITVFALGSYDICPYARNVVPLSSYLNYYGQPVRSYLFAVESVITSMNSLIFVFYMILLFTNSEHEKERIQSLYEQLMEANRQLKAYSIELERMTEIRERNRLAREIHDTLGHTLTGIIMSAEASLAVFDSQPEAVKKRLALVAKEARSGLDDVRQSIKALRPDVLEKHTLDKAVEMLIENFRNISGVDITYTQNASQLDFAEDEEDALYRIIQECMTNAARHGHATHIDITINEYESFLQIDIRDNGTGTDEIKEGFGLRHMRERLEMLSGSMVFGNRKDDPQDGQQGFFLSASLPIRKKGDD